MSRVTRLALVLLLSVVFFCGLVSSHALGGQVERSYLHAVAPERVRVDPGASTFFMNFALLSSRDSTPAMLQSVRIRGANMDAEVKATADLLPVNLARGMNDADTRLWADLWGKTQRESLGVEESKQYGILSTQLSQALPDGGKVGRIRLDTNALPAKLLDFTDYTVTAQVRQGSESTTIQLTLAIRSLPSDSSWSPADLHLHTTFSDGNLTAEEVKLNLINAGYRILYITDHCDLIPVKAGSWSNYSSALMNLSDSSISLYPGSEMTVKDTSGAAQGDLVAHGITSLNGLANIYYPQTGINNVLANSPSSPSSPSIVHPLATAFVPAWSDYTVNRYRGFELMAALQLSFGDSSGPVVRWVSELNRLLPDTFGSTEHYFASARTGSDWHNKIFDPAHPGYVTWVQCAGQWYNKATVDRALYDGQTVASRKGGLGFFTVTHAGSQYGVGQRVTGVATGATLRADITFKPVETGTYTIVIRDGSGANVFYYTGAYYGGYTYFPAIGHQFTFGGGQRFYYLYISGPDFIYSSPIFVGN